MINRARKYLILLMAFANICLIVNLAGGEEPLPKELEGVDVTEKFDSQLDLDLNFVTHEGKKVPLSFFFRDGKPVLLTLNYYSCPMLCTLQLNALLDALRGMKWTPGNEFRIVTLSIDHREKFDLAATKRATYIDALKRGDVDWTFLVGDESTIKKLADEVGVGFRFDKEQNQYAHPAAVIVLSPLGKVSRYLYGIEYKPRDIKFSLIDASQGRVGSTIDKLVLSCFHYDPKLGRYGPFALGIMRLGGVITILLILWFLVLNWQRERRAPHV